MIRYGIFNICIMVDRINLLLKAKNKSSRQFAEEIGIQPSGMSHILSGRNNPSLDFVMKVVKRWPEININWLMFGKGEMYVSSNGTQSVPDASRLSVVLLFMEKNNLTYFLSLAIILTMEMPLFLNPLLSMVKMRMLVSLKVLIIYFLVRSCHLIQCRVRM